MASTSEERAKNRDKQRRTRERMRQTREGWLQHRLYTVKMRAKLTGVAYSLSVKDVELPDFCPALGIALDYGAHNRKRPRNVATLDRVNPAIGYVKGNVRVISWRANRLKQDATPEELLALAVYAESI